jgi:2'-5' RNA ligase
MSEQLSLLGFEPTPPTDRLFFAIFPDADAAARIAKLAERLRGKGGLKGKPLATERFHVTLHHLGDYIRLPQDIVAAAREAAAAVTAPPFDVLFDYAVSFVGRPRNRPFVLRGGDGVAALMAFQQSLGLAMRKAGLGRWVDQRFTPHVTLLYDDRFVDEQRIEPIGWAVHEFVLVHSLLGRSEHIPLERWPLGAQIQPF